MIKISEMRSVHFYSSQLGQDNPSAVSRWEHYGYHIDDWKEVYRRPYLCTKSTKLQTLQYQVLNRFIPTKRYLFMRNITETSTCAQCDRIDTLEHFLFRCNKVRSLWRFLFDKLNERSLETVETIIFGAKNKSLAINLLIILTKQHIVHCKLALNPTVPTLQGLTHFICNQVEIERRIASKNDKMQAFENKWAGMIEENGCFAIFSR